MTDLQMHRGGYPRALENQERLVRNRAARHGYRIRIPRAEPHRYQLIHRPSSTLLLETESLEAILAFMDREEMTHG
jgi:hypothetical protein